MASSLLSRASLAFVACLVMGSWVISPANGETTPAQRISESIASRLTTTIPLKQCEYPRLWSHGAGETRDVAIDDGTRHRSSLLHHTHSIETVSTLREAPIPGTLAEGRSISNLLPSEETAALFRRIASAFIEQGYRVPETLALVDSRTPNAFVRKGREVVLTTAMASQVTEPSEVAFILAHEVAHVALGHHVQGGVSDEVAADALALTIVTSLGFNPCSGSNVLERLGSPSHLTLVSVTPRLHALHDQTSSFCG